MKRLINNGLQRVTLSPPGCDVAESAIIRPTMPSPIGHALGGVIVAWIADLMPGRPDRGAGNPAAISRLSLACAGLAALPDADLLLPIAHRTVTHSLGAVVAVGLFMIIATAVTGKVTRRI